MTDRSESLEAFVERLQQDGVEAGRSQAAAIVAAAERQAEQLLEQARAEAEQIRNGAQQEAELILNRGRVELEQAARDVLQRLKVVVDESLHRILQKGIDPELQDTDFLKSLIREVAGAYVKADMERRDHQLRLPDGTKAKVEGWVAQQLALELGSRGELTLAGGLRSAGFELRRAGATLEVTVESLTDLVADFVSPGVRSLVAPLPKSGQQIN